MASLSLWRVFRAAALAATVALAAMAGQPGAPAGAAEIKLGLDRLSVLGGVLMIAAHPDDENTALLAYFAKGRRLRTAYLSLTRGEGGQNLIGPEQGDLLGLIRTQELLAARRLDGAEQFFTRAIDFGYSKTAEETLRLWGRERILGDVVRVIRRFQPDVIIMRFSGTGRDGHGHHQSSAILAQEAFTAAGDPKRFPEQLRWVSPWQARRLLFNVFSFGRQAEQETSSAAGRLEIDTGEYEPMLGRSYGEIAGASRSLHRSQGFGAAERRGSLRNFLQVVAGEPASRDPLEGVDTTWGRVPGSGEAARVLAETARAFDFARPENSVPGLLAAREALSGLRHPWAERKRREIEELVAQCAGLWLDSTAGRWAAVPGGGLKVSFIALNRSRVPVVLEEIALHGIGQAPPLRMGPDALEYNQPRSYALEVRLSPDQPLSQPYWLLRPPQGTAYDVADQSRIGQPENEPLLRTRFLLRIASVPVELERDVIHRYVDRVRGELTRPLAVVPPVTLRFSEAALVFAGPAPKTVEVQVQANVAGAGGTLRVAAPPGWQIEPREQAFRIAGEGEQASLSFTLTPPAAEGAGELRAVAQVGGAEIVNGMEVIDHPHIPPQTLLPPARAAVVRVDARCLARRVGYVMGAGDDVPQALQQLGVEVALLSDDELARGELSGFDAIVTGVRAYNVRRALRANQQRLLNYVEQGGTLVVQYNVLEGGFLAGDPRALDKIGPYPLAIGRERVSVEEAPVVFLNPAHPLMRLPNRLTPRDFEGWIQERGLYFAASWDPRYQPLVETNDPGEKPLRGGLLYARHGRGAYIFTGYSWFRQLPAAVPGAYRIFANLLSSGKIQP